MWNRLYGARTSSNRFEYHDDFQHHLRAANHYLSGYDSDILFRPLKCRHNLLDDGDEGVLLLPLGLEFFFFFFTLCHKFLFFVRGSTVNFFNIINRNHLYFIVRCLCRHWHTTPCLDPLLLKLYYEVTN